MTKQQASYSSATGYLLGVFLRYQSGKRQRPRKVQLIRFEDGKEGSPKTYLFNENGDYLGEG